MAVSLPELFLCTDVHGVSVNRSTMPQALREVEALMARRRGDYVCFFEANLFSRALGEPPVREVVNRASLVYPDGIAPAKSASWRSGKYFERVSGPSFILAACEYGLDKNWRHFFLGGAEGVADRLAGNLKKKYPGLQVAGTCCPPFRTLSETEEDEIRQRIEESRTDLLWVGLGGPKQEFWMRAHQGKIDVPVMLGVGAAFDFHSGNRSWAPKIVRTLGLEWFWRMCSGGRRTFFRNVRCVSRVAWVLAGDFLRFRLLRKKKTPLFRREPGAEAASGADPMAAERRTTHTWLDIVIGGLIACGIIWLLGAVFLTSPTLSDYEPRLGFAPRCAGSWKQERKENWTTNRFCEFGFEVHEQRKLHSGKPKIIIYGDSYIEAAMIPGEDRMQNRFVNARREAVGVGYSGIGAAEYCFLVRHIPAVVEKVEWHVIFVGDIYDFLGIDPKECSSNLPGALPTKSSSVGDRFSARWRLFAFRAMMRHWRTTRIDWFGNRWQRQNGPETSNAEKHDLSAICRELKAAAGAVRLLMVYAPQLPRIHRGRVVMDPPDAAFGRELAHCCRRNGIDFLDLGPDFIAYFHRSGKFPRGFFNTPPGEGHLNSAGHEIAAAALSRYFRKVR